MKFTLQFSCWLLMAGLMGAFAAAVRAQPAIPSGSWYVATHGSDANDCLSPASACATLNGAIGKAGPGDTILVAAETFTSTSGSEVVLINKSLTLSGGWEPTFATRFGLTTVDGGGSRRGIAVSGGVTVTLEHFLVQNGAADNGGGIHNAGKLILNGSEVRQNWASGIYTVGDLILNNSSVVGNTGKGGIFKFLGTLTLNNSTISGNAGYWCGGVCNANPGNISINSSTITGNSTLNGAGVISHGLPNEVTLRNTVLAGNTPSDCSGQLALAGYNLLGSAYGCNVSWTDTDLIDVDAQLGPLEGSPAYHSLLPSSPAVNGGHPLGCTNHLGEALDRDQRGQLRVGPCDMGAYELGLSVEKEVAGDFRPGGQADFLLRLRNLEQIASLPNVTLTDTLPAGLTLIPESLDFDGGSATAVGNAIFWDGTVAGADETLISFSAAMSDTVNWGTWITNTAHASWGGVTQSAAATLGTFPKTHLPLLMRDYCPPTYFDDFSRPSGWPVGENDVVSVQYLDGEYKVVSKQPYLFLFRAPTCARLEYVLEADLRWDSQANFLHGLLFGLTSDFGFFHFLNVDTTAQEFAIYFFRPNGTYWTVAAPTYTPAIHSGTETNHLKVSFTRYSIGLEINGVNLGGWGFTTYNATYVGIALAPYLDQPVADSRWDNFRISPPGAAAAVVAEPAPDAGILEPAPGLEFLPTFVVDFVFR